MTVDNLCGQVEEENVIQKIGDKPIACLAIIWGFSRDTSNTGAQLVTTVEHLKPKPKEKEKLIERANSMLKHCPLNTNYFKDD